jgi:hypothetical protein
MKRSFPNLLKILFALVILGWSSGVQAQYSGGDGSSGTPFQINKLADLVYLSGNSGDWGFYFIQTADIDASSTSLLNAGAGFLPIGNDPGFFAGSYDGQNHTISNLFINRPGTDNVGLFGYANGAIKNLGLLNVLITGQNNVGALGGTLPSSDNCYATGNVSGISFVGGLGGLIGISSNCHASCDVSGTDYIGGFGGSNLGFVTQCYSTGTVSGSNFVGGCVGYNNNAMIMSCYSTGSVTGTGNSVGGLVGFNINGSVLNSFATGSVAGDSYVGGLVGGNDAGSSVQFCYSKGHVMGNSDKGGLVGWVEFGGLIEYSFWDNQTSGQSTSAGGTGKTTAEMKRVGIYLDPGLYTPWDFSLAGNNWAYNGTDNDGYPFLRYETHTPADIWLGTSSTDWATAGNWSENAAPGSGTTVFVPDVLNDPRINTTGEIAGNLTIEAGGLLSIATGGQLEVTGIMNNNAGTSGFVINSGGSLKTNASGVAATVKRDIPDAPDNDRWHLFISPVTAPIQATAASCFNEAYLDRYNESAGEWVRLLTNDYVTPDIGYSINYMAGFKSLDFPGVLKPSPVVYSDLSYTPDAPGYLEGWNLVGNPYPCGINPELFSVPVGMNAFAYVWDGAAGNYTTLSIGSNTNPGIIASLQGFFVRTNSATNSLTLANAAKTHSGAFLKNASVVPEMLKLKINGNGYSDAAFVRFCGMATPDFDQEFDAYKMAGIDEAPQLYSILPGEKATVNSLPSIQNNSEVALGLKVGVEATYTLNISGIESFDAAAPLFLEDLKTNSTRDLRQNAVYTFTSAPGDAEHRFNLHFTNTVGIKEVAGSKVGIYSNRNTVYIRNDKNLKGKIEVYDISGRLIRSSLLTGNQLDKVEIVNYKGSMLVKVITDKAITIEKVFVN